MYHRFNENKYPSTNIQIEIFKKQIEIIKKNNFEFNNPVEFDLKFFSPKSEKKINMINLIIDAAKDKIFFKIIADDKSYISEYINSRENFDKFVVLLFKFLEKNRINIKEINNIFINQGPGKFSGTRASLAAAKGLSVSHQFNLYGFDSNQVNDQNYNEIIDLFNKGLLRKNLIKPQYSS